MATAQTSTDTRVTRNSRGLRISMMTQVSRMVKAEEMSCISPTCMTEDTFSRSLVIRLRISPVLWESK